MTEDNIKIFELLQERHASAACELNFDTPFELLIAVVLSAQCTDKRVNAVTKELFKAASTPEQFCAMPLDAERVAIVLPWKELTRVIILCLPLPYLSKLYFLADFIITRRSPSSNSARI